MLNGRSMTGPEIMRFVKRNAYRPDLLAAHWHRRSGVFTSWAICVANPMQGFAYRVEFGDIPEHTIEDPVTHKVLVRGWKGLFKQMLADGVIKPSAEVRRVLGDDFNYVEHKNEGFHVNIKAHEMAKGDGTRFDV